MWLAVPLAEPEVVPEAAFEVPEAAEVAAPEVVPLAAVEPLAGLVAEVLPPAALEPLADEPPFRQLLSAAEEFRLRRNTARTAITYDQTG